MPLTSEETKLKKSADFKAWRASRVEQERERSRAYRLANLERLRKKDRDQYALDRTKGREKNSQQHEKHKLSRNAKSVEWRKKNPDKVREYCRRRRAKTFFAEGSHTQDDLVDILRLQGGKCAACKIKLRSGRQVDHIIPLTKGGSDDRRNLQFLCRPCNQSKKDQNPGDFARRKGLLI